MGEQLDKEYKDEEHKDEEYGKEFTEEELEALFQAADEENPPPPFFQRPWFHRTVAGVLSVMLAAQMFAFFPQLFSLAAIRFLKVSAELSQSEEIQLYKQSVVVIRTEDSKGTGFLIREDGLVVTNRHVIEGAAVPRVHFPDGTIYPASVLYTDDEVDLALLDIDGTHTPTFALAKQYDGAEGAPIYIIGNPLVFSGIANVGETWGYQPGREPPMMLLQAPVYRGNSGSPVITRSGEVIGVVFATSYTERNGEEVRVGLAVPVEWVWKAITALGESPS